MNVRLVMISTLVFPAIVACEPVGATRPVRVVSVRPTCRILFPGRGATVPHAARVVAACLGEPTRDLWAVVRLPECAPGAPGRWSVASSAHR